jgi:thiamine-phosphate pyrophosphorylase
VAARVNFRLYLISDRTGCGGRSLPETLAQACRAGVRAVQIREKDLPSGDLLRLVQDVQSALVPYRPALLINDRVDVACIAQAAGVHLPEAGLPPPLARRCLPAGALIGCSTHSAEAARRAEAQGADFLTFGPVFSTPSKAGYGAPQGLEALKAVTQAVRTPVFAIGGVTPERVRACMEAGASGVAVISAILAAPDVQAAVRGFAAVLDTL